MGLIFGFCLIFCFVLKTSDFPLFTFFKSKTLKTHQNIAATALGPSWEDRSRSEDSGKKQHLCTTSERRVMQVLSEQ